jgi:hypothetical protein
MNYLITDEVPEHWNDIIDAFATMSEWEVEFNKGTPIDCVEFRVSRGLLAITYEDGDTITDAHARFAREMSAKICYSCGAPATREVFQYRKCEECD